MRMDKKLSASGALSPTRISAPLETQYMAIYSAPSTTLAAGTPAHRLQDCHPGPSVAVKNLQSHLADNCRLIADVRE